MSEEKMRAFEFDGKRRGIRLDEGTWQAVDWLAKQRGVKWQALANEWVVLATGGKREKGDNLTGIVRTAVMGALLEATILQERADMHQNTGPIWQALGMCDDTELHESLTQAQSIEGTEDFVGFKLAAGINEFGFVTFYIENGIKKGSNLIISTPVKADKWAQEMEMFQ